MITKEKMQELTREAKAKQMEVNVVFAEKWLDSNMEEDFFAAAASGKTYIVFHVPEQVHIEALRKVLGGRGFRVELAEYGSIYYHYNLPEPQIVCHWFF